jgi:hypothetical protein
MKMKVLHDFDSPFLSGRYALKRGIQLVLYAISKKIKFLRRFEVIEEVYNETTQYALTLAKLDKISNVQSFFGIHHNVRNIFPEFSRVVEQYDANVIEHWHELSNGNSISKWNPPLHQRKETWHYDLEYKNKGKEVVKLAKDEMPIFHVDYPHLLEYYIDWLYFVLIQKGQIYINSE